MSFALLIIRKPDIGTATGWLQRSRVRPRSSYFPFFGGGGVGLLGLRFSAIAILSVRAVVGGAAAVERRSPDESAHERVLREIRILDSKLSSLERKVDELNIRR